MQKRTPITGVVLPTPDEPKVSLPGCARAAATNWSIDRNGDLSPTNKAKPDARASSVTGVKSSIESYGSFYIKAAFVV